MTTHNIVWTVVDRIKLLALAGLVAAAAACSGGPDGNTLLDPSPLRPPTVYAISGTVFAAMEEGALPVEGAIVEATNAEGTILAATTDAEGRYALSLTRGLWSFLVAKHGYRQAFAEIELSDGASVDFMLEPADEIALRRGRR